MWMYSEQKPHVEVLYLRGNGGQLIHGSPPTDRKAQKLWSNTLF